jgi:hypothetical protein
MRKLIFGAAMAAVFGASAAHAAVTLDVTTAKDFATFNNNAIGSTSGVSYTDEGTITWSTTGDSYATNTSVSGVSLAPYGDTTTYLYATVGSDVDVNFSSAVDSFVIYWGSPDSYNSITLSDGEVITGSEILALTGSDPGVDDGFWIRITDTSGITGFVASSTAPAFEFDMAAPEPSTWAMMGLGFAALGFAAYRRSSGRRSAVA